MDKKALTVLQKLSDLPPEYYFRVADVLMREFGTPPPQPTPPQPPKPSLRPGPGRKSRGGRRPLAQAVKSNAKEQSLADSAREILRRGPVTAQQLTEELKLDKGAAHPLFARIGAVPVGTFEDAEGGEYKTYGLEEAG